MLIKTFVPLNKGIINQWLILLILLMKNFKKVFFIILSLFCVEFASGQDSLKFNPVKPNKFFFKSVLLDTRDVFIAPVHWQKQQWIMAGGVCAVTGGLIAFDRQINLYTQQKRNSYTDTLSKLFFEPIGRGIYSFPILGAFGLHHAITGNERSGRVFYLGAKSAAISALLVTVLKYTFERHRPYQDNPANPYQWEFYRGKLKYRSFPSGHTITAFSVATIIATEFNNNWYVPLICYTLAGLAGLSRMNDNKHWASDVFMGAALGFSVSKMIYYRNNWKINLKAKPNKWYGGQY
jgi:membrane-associated phospholipid phosphatase